MLLSVIVPVYNGEKYIARCLDSLLNQDLDHKSYEIIVINDGSKDHTIAIIENYKKYNKNIISVSQVNQGQSVARNKGIELAKGEYIYFVDGDDYIAENTLKTITIMALNNQLDIFGFSLKSVANNEITHASNINEDFVLNVQSGLDFIGSFNYNNGPWWYIVKRQLILTNKLSFVPDRLCEDGMFTATLFTLDCKVGYVPYDIYRYVSNPGSTTTRRDQKHMQKIVDDFIFTIKYFSNLLCMKSVKGHCGAFEKLKSRQASYVFFLLVRILRCDISLRQVGQILNELKIETVYPIHVSIGDGYGYKVKLLCSCFNTGIIYKAMHLILRTKRKFLK